MKKAGIIVFFVLMIVIMFISTGCGSASPSGATSTGRGSLVSVTPLGIMSAAQLNAIVTGFGIAGITPRYDVQVYKIVYKTVNPTGIAVDASGLLLVPQKSFGMSSPLLSYQHGTITLNNDAPSNISAPNGGGEGILGSITASLGYVVMMPDYLGYGASAGMVHPYVHANTLASATIDMIRASKQYLGQIASPTNGKLFLMGYSEGGYATLATQREMETNLTGEFTITASEPGAGPYDMSNTAQVMLAAPNLPVPAFVAFVIKGYDTIYNNPSNISTYVNPAYITAVNTSFDGTQTLTTINANLGGVNVATSTLFNPTFLANFASAAGEVVLKTNIAQNDIYSWGPKAPTRLFHGSADTTVPYTNTTTAFTAMSASGALNVQIVNCTPAVGLADHANCGLPHLLDTKAFFDTMTPGL